MALGPLALPAASPATTVPSPACLQWARQRLDQGDANVNALFEQQMLDSLSALFQRRAAISRTDFRQLHDTLLGQPERGTPWVRWIRDTRYGTGPDGLDGNDDGGTLSAWYVWSALGLYPVAGTETYALGPPLFDRAEVDLPSGALLELRREGPAEGQGAWMGVKLEDQPWEGGTLLHSDIQDGAVVGEWTKRRRDLAFRVGGSLKWSVWPHVALLAGASYLGNLSSLGDAAADPVDRTYHRLTAGLWVRWALRRADE